MEFPVEKTLIICVVFLVFNNSELKGTNTSRETFFVTIQASDRQLYITYKKI